MKHVHEDDPPVTAEAADAEAELSIEEAKLRQALGDNAGWVDELKTGLALEEFQDSEAGRYLATQCVNAIQDAFNAFLAAETHELAGASERVRVAHADARAANSMLSLIKAAIEAGREAEARLEQRHEPS